MSKIHEYSMEGSPTPEEEATVMVALERMLHEEAERARPSKWKLTGRADSLQLRGRGDAE